MVGGGPLAVGKVGTVGGTGTLTVGTGTLTVGTGTLTVGTGTLTVGRLDSALAGAITWPEPYPALNTHAPMSNIPVLAPAPLVMISHRGRLGVGLHTRGAHHQAKTSGSSGRRLARR
jgi:X-X-X-Leu-X-X-Gly heptad repeat protein